MLKYLLASLFCLFIIFNGSAQSQSLSDNKSIPSPFIDLDELLDPELMLVKKHDPFDDMTLLTPKFGARVYSDEEIFINMFSIAFSAGNVNSYHPNMVLGLLFLAFENSDGSDEISLANSEIIFLIDNERHVKKIDDFNVVSFDDHSLYQKLATSNEVRARISINQNNYELELNSETTIAVRALLSEITNQ